MTEEAMLNFGLVLSCCVQCQSDCRRQCSTATHAERWSQAVRTTAAAAGKTAAELGQCAGKVQSHVALPGPASGLGREALLFLLRLLLRDGAVWQLHYVVRPHQRPHRKVGRAGVPVSHLRSEDAL